MAPDQDPTAGEALQALLAQQAQLRDWIDRLDEEADDVPSHVMARVRVDYEARLGALVEQLREHAEGLRAELDRLRAAASDARETHQRAADDLAEARLRHRLGEWGPEEWAARRGDLERAADDASAREVELLADADRCEGILEQIDAPAPPDAPLPELLDRGSNFALSEPEGWGPAAGGAAGNADLAFLEDLDEAIGVNLPAVPAGEPPVTGPPAGIKCRECGYTNDPSAAFCGVCGVDLA